MHTNESSFKCDQCGMCCQSLFIFIGPEDLQREPRLRKAVSPLKNLPEEQELFGEFSNKYLLSAGWAIPCPFLDDNNLCTIYETRPENCRNWEPDKNWCRSIRRKLLNRNLSNAGESQPSAMRREKCGSYKNLRPGNVRRKRRKISVSK